MNMQRHYKVLPLTDAVITALNAPNRDRFIASCLGVVTFRCTCRPMNRNPARFALARNSQTGRVWLQHFPKHRVKHEPECPLSDPRRLLDKRRERGGLLTADARLTGLFSLTSKSATATEEDSGSVNAPHVNRAFKGIRLAPSTLVKEIIRDLGLNEYHPDDPMVDRPTFIAAMRRVLDGKRWTFQRSSLKDLIAVPGSGSVPEGWFERTRPKDGVSRYGMALGVLSGIERDGDFIILKFDGSDRPIRMLKSAFESQTKSLVRSPTHYISDANVIFFGRVTSTSAGLLCDEVSLVVTSRRWVPVESKYELQMVNNATDQGRHFTRPLGASPHDYVHDLLLHDCFAVQSNDGSTDVVIEVNGFTSDRYILDKQALQDVLKITHPGRFIFWWPWRHEPLPRFPPAFASKRITPLLAGFTRV